MARKKPDSAPKKKARPAAESTPVGSITHKDSRTNIPTRELAGFAAEDEKAPTTILYARDPSLDPQLVWTGKDEQDRNPLEVPAVPIYIQEKIHPRAIIEDLLERATAGKPQQLDLFSDFNGLDDFEKKVDFYHHDQHWSNRMILGNSLHVMTSLAEKERLKGQVQMIYMDPPYGIKFGSNWQVSTRKRDVKDAKAEDVTRQPEQIQAFRDTWALGIHSYLPYLRDRLVVARDLLTESGSIFVQIGDENLHHVRELMDEVFGAGNFVLTIIIKKKGATTPTDSVNDYIIWFAKDKKHLKVRQLFLKRSQPEDDPKFNTLISVEGKHIRVADLDQDEIARYAAQGYRWARANYPIVSQHPSEIRGEDFVWNGKRFSCGANNQWRFDPKTQMVRLAETGRLFDGGGKSLGGVMYWDDWPYVTRSNIWDDLHGEQEIVYVVQTNRKAPERCMLMTTDPGDLVLDPTCGGGTTAYVAEQWGRRWITIDTSRVALALARTRLMAAKFPYYLLTDSPEGRKKEAEILGVAPDAAPCGNDIRRGFVYKRVPHVTLKSIANNPDIREGMTREQIDAAIRKHAETETLYDQPYEDKGVVRVTGPFTVEALSPHRMLPTPGDSESTLAVAAAAASADYLTTILDNLRKAGVQNTVKNERLLFDRLDVFPGEYIQAEGTYTENGKSKAVRVSVGPEFGTVGPEWLQKAALEAIKGSQCELVLVCGFAFDPHVAEQTQEMKKEMRFGKVRIQAVRMNPDLTMGDELLKKTGRGNLFMVFGEPDIDLKKQKDGKLVAEIRGVDVYDPTTGQVRSHGTEDIACWFLDTDYNGESFFVRHAYFCGGDEPYEKLKKALRAEIDEAEWAKLYSTRSLPFESPKKGKIAVKVINHYGDEVLKVFRAP